jgi:ferrous iron transport protein A
MSGSPSSRASISLADLPKGGTAIVVAVREEARLATPEHTQRLKELGFMPGEQIRVVAKGFPSGDPIAVRIGSATFALRRFEAELIAVSFPAAPDPA